MFEARPAFKIKPVKGHYEVYYNGKFICSADTEAEAKKEIELYKLYWEV